MTACNVKAERTHVSLQIVGHPTDCVEKAREIAHLLIGSNGPWHFTRLQFVPPGMRGGLRDDDWMLDAFAVLKNGGN